MAEWDDAAVVALGSNLPGPFGSGEALLEAACSALDQAGVNVLRRSGWWRSQAWPDPTDPPFLNGVVLAATSLEPRACLGALLAIERAFGRARAERNAPRTLDLDLIALGRRVMDEAELVLPHPRAHRRRFVMGPLAEIAPAWRHPTLGRTAAELAASAVDGADAQPVTTKASSRPPHSAQEPS